MNRAEKNPTLVDPEMKEIVESFIVETKEILDKLDTDLIELEKKPDDKDLLNQIFRSFHTIKGTSGFLGLEALPEVTHKCEDILNKLRKGEANLNSELMDGILLAFDTIKELVVKIETEQNENVDTENVCSVLQNLLNNLESTQKAKTEILQVEEQNTILETHNIAEKEIELKNLNESEEKKDIRKTDEFIAENETDEKHNEQNQELKSEAKNVDKIEKAASTSATKENTIRVDVDRLDSLLDIVSELVLGRNRLSQINTQFAREFEGNKFTKDFEEVTKQIDLMTTELQLVSMKLRMIKIAKIFNRYPRLVRDLCKDLNKEVELIIRGEDTEVDKNLIEEINDPLVHLIRNAVDHGVEKPEVRIKAGKNPKGTVILSAEQLGNNIVITIQDDGKGLNVDFIKEKAISKGLITKEKAKELSKQEAMNLIFLPGFSTAEKVSNVSGRGVGMDVVKTNVTKLRGIINIESEVGQGTKIEIKLPLTLAIISGMIVKANQETLVIPLGSVVEVLRVDAEQIYSIKGREVIQVRDSVLPLVSINELLKGKMNGRRESNNGWQYVVEVGIAEKRYGIKVDELIGQQEVVIKSLGSYLGKINGIAGSTIMGDGTVVMILDLHELFNKLEQYS
ncbi:chemotaxis protein CheA [Stygiobacter electus]|uniref:histidine kinase n=1 Tax=Stygiobacter electus TaxID=3032292 RepID=A0AAE3P041_9BACT|nr:chemotaxis protein CheA [Stygiobacter electus]MDF1611272.1 chemotaxis protein CheA [Stygiobacter electus]